MAKAKFVNFTQVWDHAFCGAEGWGEYGTDSYQNPFFAYFDEYTIIIDATGVTVCGGSDFDDQWYASTESPLTYEGAVYDKNFIESVDIASFIDVFLLKNKKQKC